MLTKVLEVLVCILVSYVWWWSARVGRWWERSIILLSEAEQTDSELCIGRYAFEQTVAYLQKLLPIGVLPVHCLRSQHWDFARYASHESSMEDLQYDSPLQINGSPNIPNPTANPFIFMNIYESRCSDPKSIETTTAANLNLCLFLGNGGVGDNALAKRSQPSEISATTCITGLAFVHIAAAIGSFVLS